MSLITRFTLCGAIIAACNMSLLQADPVESSAATAAASSDSPVADEHRVSVEAARERAKLMHELYSVTLDVIHQRYFHGDRAIVPARAMEDVFAEMERTSQTKARWISVNLKAMSIDHEPETDFEKRAARELNAETSRIEVVEDGYYRQARTIPLTSGCISCHGGFFKTPSKKPKFAGLVISVPVHETQK
ncbi:MAG: DUF3365 domain-containing protein [Planctomycetaceae bacterium]